MMASKLGKEKWLHDNQAWKVEGILHNQKWNFKFFKVWKSVLYVYMCIYVHVYIFRNVYIFRSR